MAPIIPEKFQASKRRHTRASDSGSMASPSTNGVERPSTQLSPEAEAQGQENDQTLKRYHTRASGSISVKNANINDIGRISKRVSQKVKSKSRLDKSKRNSKGGPVVILDRQQEVLALTTDNPLVLCPSSPGNSDVLEEILAELPNASVDPTIPTRQMMVLDAVEEPVGQETSQKMEESDKRLIKFTEISADSDDIQPEEHFFRRICILYDGDLKNKKAAIRRVLLDTGSFHSLTFESRMEKLGLHFQRYDEPKHLYSIEQTAFKVIGMRQILFKYWGKPTTHRANLRVLKDPPENLSPSFDFLLGREHLIPAKIVQIDRNLAGDTYHVAHHQPRTQI